MKSRAVHDHAERVSHCCHRNICTFLITLVLRDGGSIEFQISKANFSSSRLQALAPSELFIEFGIRGDLHRPSDSDCPVKLENDKLYRRIKTKAL